MAPRGGAAMGPQTQLHQQTRALQRAAALALQQHPLPPGWKSTLNPATRVNNVVQLITSLRLVKAMPVEQALEIVTNFELETLNQSRDKAAYDTACRDKLNVFFAEREKRAANMESEFHNPQNGQMNIGMQQMAMQNGLQNSRPGQFQQGFPNPQLQRAMQPTPMPNQQPFMQNFNQQQQHAMNNNLSNVQMQIQPAQQGQNPSQNIARPMGNNPGQLTPQETAHVMNMAQQMRSRATPQDIEGVRQKLASVGDDMKRMWHQTNTDPLTWYYRNFANRTFLTNKARMNTAQHPTMMPGVGATTQQPMSLPQNATVTAAPQFGGVTQGFDPSFGGNMQQFGSQIFGLQQDALRSQEEGQVVVPVSGNQTASHQQPQGSMQPTPQQQTMNQPTPARSMMNPQMMQQEKMQQATRMQAQRGIQNAGGMQNQMQAQQNNLQGQAGGLNGHMNQALPQHSPAMPNLNRPLGPSTQNQGPAQLRQAGPPPQVQPKDGGSVNQHSQPQPQGQPSGGEAGQLGITPRQRQELPPGLQQRLAHMSPAQQQQFMMQLQTARANAGMRAPAGQDFQTSQAQPTQGHQVNQPAPGQTPALGVQNFGGFDQNLSQPQNMIVPGQQAVQGRPFEAQFRPQQPQQAPQSRVMQFPPKISDEQVRMMDQRPFPPSILSANTMPPPSVKLWGDLKAWVAQNQASMPPDVLGKLRNVQAAQYSDLAKRHAFATQQRAGQMALAQTSMSPAPVQQPGPAPPAPMVGTHGNMSQVPNSNPLPMNMPPNMPAPQPPSAEELRNVRIQNPKFQSMPDDVLRQQVMRQRMLRMQQAFAVQHRQNMTPQQAQFENMQRAQLQQQFQKQAFLNGQNNQAGQAQSQPPSSQGQQAASHAVKAATPLMGQGTLQEPPTQPSRPSVRPSVQNQQGQKGTKRANEDDVVEVPNPKLAQQQQNRKVQPPAKQTPSQQKPNPSQPVRDTALQQQQQKQSSQYALELRNQAAQTMSSTTPQQIPPQIVALARTMAKTPQENAARAYRYKQIFDELSKNTHARPEVPMDSQTRNNVITFLTRSRDGMMRAKGAISQFYITTKDEDKTRELLQLELSFSRQFRGDQLADRFTMSLADLQEAYNKIMTCARMMIAFYKFKQQATGKPQQPSPVESSVGAANVATGTPKAAPETQTRQAPALQRNHSNRENRAPAAPTSDKPPFSFGALSPPQSGDGVPIMYGPNQLTQEKLSLPPNKRRKVQNQPGSSVSTPAQAHGTPATTASPKVTKTSSPREQRSNVAPAPTFKCPESSCEFAGKGFATMEDLNKHTTDKHPVVEPPIEDPLEWALEGIRMGLGLGLSMDASKDTTAKTNGLAKHMEMESERSALASVAMKKSASMQGLTPMRMEGGTPMSRMASQAGYQSNLGVPRTPQQTNNSVKTPASDNKQSTSKSGPGESKKVGSTPKEPSTPPNNLWKDASVSPSDLSSFFPSPHDLQGLSLGILTPASTLSNSKSTTNSPKESDIGEGDMLDIRIESDTWRPAAWGPDPFVESSGKPLLDDEWGDLTDPLLDLSWEDAFEKIIQPDKTTKEWKNMTVEQQEDLTPFDAGRFTWENFP
ncbi:hypothetical protein MMC30_005771 [Trapelia coarctata]|nr:hypothetical protein [Trapelia coarctata]